MTNRAIVYSGAIPLDGDILYPQQQTMIALGALVQSAFGTATFADGLVCTQTTVASMSVSVGQGWLGALTTVEPNAYGSISADAVTPLMKMGINLAATQLGPMTAPGTAGQSVVYLVQAAFSETDTTPIVLPYYNSANPSVPFAGPGGAGATQNTRRVQTVTLQLKQGTATTTGSQTTPAADSGFTGLWAITITNGASTVVNGNIVAAVGAPFIDGQAVGRGLRTGRLINVQTFASAGTFTYVPTPGTGAIEVDVQGAGGGGGGTAATGASQVAAGGGGGAGGWARKRIVSGFAGTTITVGAAGAGAGAGAAGGNGGSSSFGSVCSATGGSGGTLGGAGTATGVPAGGGAPGTGASGDVNGKGGAGGYAILTNPALSGAGGRSFYGDGGAGAVGSAGGGAGVTPGSGGGGTAQSTPSAGAGGALAGAPGIVIIREYA